MRLELEVQSIPALTSETAKQKSLQETLGFYLQMVSCRFPESDAGKTANQLLQHPMSTNINHPYKAASQPVSLFVAGL